MKLIELSDKELRRVLSATEHFAGPDSYTVKVLRRELARRRERSMPAGLGKLTKRVRRGKGATQ